MTYTSLSRSPIVQTTTDFLRRLQGAMQTIQNPFLLLRIAVTIISPLCYFIFHLSYTRGPLFASSDEGGYLSAARTLTGHDSAIPSAVFPGSAVVLAPLYLILNDPRAIWVGALALNCVLASGILYLSGRLIKHWNPNATPFDQFITVLVVAVLPLLPTMTGYVFPSVLGTFGLLLSAFLITPVIKGRHLSTCGFLATICFLCTVHPTHLVLPLGMISVIALSRHRIIHKLLYVFVPMFCAVALVRFGVAWLPQTFSVFERSNGPTYGGLQRFSGLLKGGRDAYVNLLKEIVTVSTALIAATFGLVGVVMWSLGVQLRKNKSERVSREQLALLSFIVLAIVGYVLLTSHAFGFLDNSTYVSKRIEENIFLRYLEPVLPLCVIVGLTEMRDGRQLYRWAFIGQLGIVVIGGLVLAQTLSERSTTSGEPTFIDFFKFMANEYWPAYHFTSPNVLWWTGLSLLGLFAVYTFPRTAMLTILFVGLPLVLASQSQFHRDFSAEYSDPGSIPKLIQANYRRGTCIGFDTELRTIPFDEDGPYRRFLTYQETQFGNLSYWLGDFDLQRLTRSDWERSCSGPLIAFHPVFDYDTVVASDPNRQMVLIERRLPDYLLTNETRFRLSIASTAIDRCMRSGCFGLDASQLSTMTGVGKFKDGYLSTSGKAGQLFLTPGAILHRGTYFLEIHGSFLHTQGAHLRVVADDGTSILIDKDLPLLPQSDHIRIPLTLRSWVSDLRIEVQVTDDNDFSIRGIRVVSD